MVGRGLLSCFFYQANPFRVRVLPSPTLVKAGLAWEMCFLSERDPAQDSSNNHQRWDKLVLLDRLFLLDKLVMLVVVSGAVFGRVLSEKRGISHASLVCLPQRGTGGGTRTRKELPLALPILSAPRPHNPLSW